MTAPLPDAQLQHRYETAKTLATEAARLAELAYRQRDTLVVEHKGDELQDLVSIVDKQTEAFIKQTLAEAFPEDGFLGEETGAADLDARCIWVVDPIDGTSCFVNGLHSWCVSIGLLVDGKAAIGVIADAVHGELFHARSGHGAWLNDQPMRVRDVPDVRHGVMGMGTNHRDGKEHFIPVLSQLLEQGGTFIRNGSGALMTAYVAAGRLIGYYETHINSWDCLAGLVMVAEAGGRDNDFLRGNGLLSGNPLLVAGPQVYAQVAAMVGPTLDA
ncbi:inositol monophosphatase family protein [Pseudomonas sp. dw_358]|uniref:inositol monophosphatase family protein n=1 Tax=Pseudomonas sp. dw_358 TaxID=2720083 RepID=UPI001BD42B7B|nr:inositol monophosphatase family protein [Pseudomonas sp. dw_358]